MPSGSNGLGSGSGLKIGGTVATVMMSSPGSAGGAPGRNCRNRADSGPLAGCSSFGGIDSGAAVRSGGSGSGLARALSRATGSLLVALPRFSRRFDFAGDLPGDAGAVPAAFGIAPGLGSDPARRKLPLVESNPVDPAPRPARRGSVAVDQKAYYRFRHCPGAYENAAAFADPRQASAQAGSHRRRRLAARPLADRTPARP